jgi:PKD repeat protein
LDVVENATGNHVAFRTRQNQLHLSNTPHIDYAMNVTDHTLGIEDIEIAGTYQTINWDFGDGHAVDRLNPGQHTYTTAGDYTITTTITYGNRCSISDIRTVYIDSVIYKAAINFTDMHIFPVHAHDHITVTSDNISGRTRARMFNTLGQLVYMEIFKEAEGAIDIDVSKLTNGIYLLQLDQDGMVGERMVEVMRNE